jgi:hypothetical protein
MSSDLSLDIRMVFLKFHRFFLGQTLSPRETLCQLDVRILLFNFDHCSP